jgi:hypothetical protein
MTTAMLIPSPLASARPNAVAVATHVLPKAWACTHLVADVKGVRAQEAGREGKVGNQMCQAKSKYACVNTAGLQESWTRTCAGPRHGSPIAGPLRA